MTTTLRVENVSKQYRIYSRPGDRLKESLTRGRLRRHREFWALQNITFEVGAGTTLGIVGPNGSGKSTLLQIISGTLEPTHGEVWYTGRVAALLELGSGFDPEFTGAENVRMNAALMGFNRRKIDKLFPEIERFAEIGSFIHQPVKTYSSGMYVRLAFAIAASVEPEILVVDEALAVGDAVFQHRCLRRINELQECGCTILFVSHDLAAVRALCSRAILLNAGRIVADGKPADVLNRYQKLIMAREEAYEAERLNSPTVNGNLTDDKALPPLKFNYRHGDGSAEILGVELTDAAHRAVEIVETGEPVRLRMLVHLHRDIEAPVFGFLIRNRHGIHAYGTNSKEQQLGLGIVRRGENLEVTFIFNCWLGVDQYSIGFAVHSPAGEAYDWIDGAIFFRVTSTSLTEGVANLNASVTARRYPASPTPSPLDESPVNARLESVSHG